MSNIKTVKSELLNEEYKEVIHKSGLKIIVYPKDRASSYALIATRFGSTFNTFRVEGEKDFVTVPDGVAHFLEHKMFENEDGEDTFVKFSRTGANANAYTSFNVTAYLFSCTDELYQSLEILLRSVFSPYFTDENVSKEQGIIAQEIRMGEDDPNDCAMYGTLEGLYEKNSVRINIAGTVPSIMKITPDILYRCHRAYYNPANMVLCVCGNAELDKVIKVADKTLHGIEPLKVETLGVDEDKKAYKPYVEKKMQVAKPICCIGIKDTEISKDPRERVKKDLALKIISSACFGRSSDFYRELYESGIISPSYGTWHMHTERFSFWTLSSDTDVPEDLYKRFKEYTENQVYSALNEESFERVRRVLYSQYIKSFDSTDSIANNIVTEFALEGAEIFDYASVLKNITLDYVLKTAHSLFDPEAYTMCAVLPI